MNDRQLRYALSVWRERSFSKAAEKLNVSQPSVSAQLHRLEGELGFKLFRRTGRGVLVTHKGQTFLHRASQVIDEFLDLSDRARQLRGGPPVSFAIGFSSSVAQAMVPVAMTALAPVLPRVRIETITGPTRRILRFVSEERLDAGITIEASPRDLPANVRTERFGRVAIVLVVAAKHRMARTNAAVDLTSLVKEKLIVHEPDIGYGQQIQTLLADRGLRLNVAAVADNAETIKLMVRSGVGLALLPRSCVDEDNAASLRVIPIHPQLELPMTLVRADRVPSPAEERYFQLLRQGLGDVRGARGLMPDN